MWAITVPSLQERELSPDRMASGVRIRPGPLQAGSGGKVLPVACSALARILLRMFSDVTTTEKHAVPKESVDREVEPQCWESWGKVPS